MQSKYVLILFYCFISGVAQAQVGGDRSFEFLNTPGNALLSGLGGVNVSLKGQDVNLFLSNPALANDTLGGYASVGFLDYLADVNLATLAYTHQPFRYGQLSVGIQNLALGEVAGFDDVGQATSEVGSGEFAFTVGYSHEIRGFRLGANLKYVNSNIVGYRASAVMADLGGVYSAPSNLFSVGLVLKNMGAVLSDYTSTSDANLPFDVQVGVSLKPKYMPFRFSFTGYNLVRENIAYFDPTGELVTDGTEPGGVDKVLRRMVFATELLLSKNINLRFGYNHLMRKELRLETTSAGAGLSFGLMFRVKSFEFAYSRGIYHAAGGLNSFTLTVNLNKVLKKN